MLTGEMLTFAYNQTQSTDVFTHIESNAKLHENCIFFFIIFLLFIFILYKTIYFVVVCYCSSSGFFII